MTVTDARVVPTADRLDWLRARQRHVTASEIPRIFKGSRTAIRSLLKEKSKPPREFHTRATDWGHEREETIIAAIQAEYPEYNVTHNEDLHERVDNPFFGATPDGIGSLPEKSERPESTPESAKDAPVDAPVYIECKTVNTNRRKAPKDHVLQVQWGLYVTGSAFAIYAWEQHTDFRETKPVKFQIIERDEEIIAQLVEVAAYFRDRMQEENAVGAAGDYNNDQLNELMTQFLTFKQYEANAKKGKEKVAKKIKEMYGDSTEEYNSPTLGTMTYQMSSPQMRVDTKLLQEKYPEIAASVTRHTKTSMTVTVTPSDTMKERLKGIPDLPDPFTEVEENPFL